MDTVVYKLHNTDNYPVILKAVQNLEEGKGVLSVPSKKVLNKNTEFSKLWFNIKTDTYILWMVNARALLTSGASGVNIMYDRQRDYIKFELSLPKFFHANNVIELLPPYFSKYRTSTYNMSDLCAQYWLKLIKAVFFKIIQDITRNLGTEFDWCDVEISRIDIAFNQIFDSKADALHYFDIAKKGKIPRLKDGSNKDYYDGAVTFLSKGNYYFKCYHKGKEFNEVSSKQIVKTYEIYKERQLLTYNSVIEHALRNTDELQEYADRILRYELECKNGLMNQLFKAHLFKRRIPEYQELSKILEYLFHERNYQIWRTVKVMYRTLNGYHSQKPRLGFSETVYMFPYIDADGKRKYAPEKNERTIGKIRNLLKCKNILKNKYNVETIKDVKLLYKMYRKDKDKNFKFFLDTKDTDAAKVTTGIDKNDNQKITLFEEMPTNQKFSISLLKLCIFKHNQLFQKLQSTEIPDFKRIEQAIELYNDTHKNKVNPNSVKLILENLKNSTWNEIQKSGQFHRSTIYRQKRKIEKILDLEKDINFIEDITLQNVCRRPSELYKRHYDIMLLEKSIINSFIQKNKILLLI